MKKEENRKKVFHELRKELRKDRAKVAVAPITEFGLLEMTRQRIRVSLLDSMSEECPSCKGSGKIISVETLITRIEHWLRRYKTKHMSLRIKLLLHPKNANYLKKEKKSSKSSKIMDSEDFKNEDLKLVFKDYYFSNVVARASKTMLDCNNAKLEIKRTGTEG